MFFSYFFCYFCHSLHVHSCFLCIEYCAEVIHAYKINSTVKNGYLWQGMKIHCGH